MKAKAPKLGPVITIWIKPVVKRTLPLLFLLFCSAAWAESGGYRVEVIVFRNLAVTAEAAEVEKLRSFSIYPALEVPVLPPPNLVMATEMTDTVTQQPGDAGETAQPGEVSAEPRRFDLPDDLRVIREKSPAVDDAWRRLRGSADYRPLLFAAWEQNRTDYYPPMRIHDQQILESRLRPPTQFMLADLTAPDPLAAYRSAFYQLDGSLQLR
ncbi:MAG: peptidoglycan binding protein CsiV, partial [Xanthomonadales bacterium]|nr:peptidoglycan binding protein CsiV [Xanthomonadales bacterium]